MEISSTRLKCSHTLVSLYTQGVGQGCWQLSALVCLMLTGRFLPRFEIKNRGMGNIISTFFPMLVSLRGRFTMSIGREIKTVCRRANICMVMVGGNYLP